MDPAHNHSLSGPVLLPMSTYTFPDSCSISSHWVCSNSDSAASKMLPCQEEEAQVSLRGGHSRDVRDHPQGPNGPALLLHHTSLGHGHPPRPGHWTGCP